MMKTDDKIIITFPDGNERKFIKGVTGNEIAESISKSLQKKAIAIKVNEKQMDLSDSLFSNSIIDIITLESDEGIEIMRHTIAAQVLANAIKNIYPRSKLAIGPTIENGFYYDVFFEKPISFENLESIENEMKRIVKRGNKINKTFKSKEEAIHLFQSREEKYKVEIINFSSQENDFQIYEQEDSKFFDLCRGPHLPSLKFVGAFKLTKLAGAYWKGDSKNVMLQRIY